jgi:hypothetical protein
MIMIAGFKLFCRRIDANCFPRPPLIVARRGIPIFVTDNSQALVIGQNVLSVLCLAAAEGLLTGSSVLSRLQEEDEEEPGFGPPICACDESCPWNSNIVNL